MPLDQWLSLTSPVCSDSSCLTTANSSPPLCPASSCLSSPAHCPVFTHLSVLPTLLFVSACAISQSCSQRNRIWFIHSAILQTKASQTVGISCPLPSRPLASTVLKRTALVACYALVQVTVSRLDAVQNSGHGDYALRTAWNPFPYRGQG